MGSFKHFLKPVVAASAIVLFFFTALPGRADDLDALFEQLGKKGLSNWEEVEDKIWAEWSQSGSASMDVLLQRGREAMEAGDLDAAIEHLTALTDHAPDFAEGWNARATAYFMAGLYGPSIEDIRRTLALNPRHFGAMSGLGMILEELGYPEDALAVYREVSAIHPNLPNVITAIERLEKEVKGFEL